MKKMIRYFFSLIIIISFSLFPPDIISVTQEENTKEMVTLKQPGEDYQTLFSLTEIEISKIDSILNRMTIRERVAQMVMPWAGGNYTSEESSDFKRIKHLVQDLKVGGLIFFKGDILNEALLINKAQAMTEIPLLISSDFERGLAMRLTDATEFPYNMALTAAGDPTLASEMGKVISRESRTIGIHQNYAPVADINVNADNPIINIRSYSEDKNVVSEYCEAFIKGSIQGRMLTTVKHFPGHGNTSVDSHQDLPVISGTRQELMANELEPFVHSIKSGVHSVMIGHLAVPAFEPEKIPATLSRKIVTDLLKNELKFKGLVVTDAMNMNAVTRYYSGAQAAVLAVKAGNDIILMPPDEDIAVNAVTDAVYNNEIPVESINESVRKILAAKIWTGVDKEKITDIARIPSIVGSRKNIFLAEEIAEKSITLVKNDNNLIPINTEKVYSTSVITITDNVFDGSYFTELADQEFGYVKSFTLGKRSTAKDYKKARDMAYASDLIILPSFIKVKAYAGSVNMPEKQSAFINDILGMKKPSVIISFGNPYLLSMFPEAKTYLAAYGDAAVSQKAALRAVTGKNNISGKLPVSIPGTPYTRGYGININRNILAEDAEGYDIPGAMKIISQNLDNKIYSGASLLVSSGSKVIFNKGFGKADYEDDAPFINNDFVYDIDEITSLAATAGALVLSSEGSLSPESRVSDYLTEIRDKTMLVKDLFVPISRTPVTNTLAAAMDENSNSETLRLLIEKVSGMGLDRFLHERIFLPLNMKHTMFNPPRELWFYAVPTSLDLHRRYKGVVFDEETYRLQGVSGHAGMFTTPRDMAVFLQMLIQRGKYEDKQIIAEDTFYSWYKNVSDVLYISGKTGASVWMDPVNQTSVVFFTNSSISGKTDELLNINPQLYEIINNYIRY